MTFIINVVIIDYKMIMKTQTYKEIEKECDERLLKAIQEFSNAFTVFSFNEYNKALDEVETSCFQNGNK